MKRAAAGASAYFPAGGPRPWLAAIWLLALTAGGILAWAMPVPPEGAPLQAPGLAHWLGTDLLGRDFGWRLLAGGMRSFAVALGATAVSVLTGGVWGIASGAAGGWIDRLLERAMDIALSVPALVSALVILAALGPGEAAVVLAVGAGGAASFARLIRAETVQIRNREFLLAARALGAGALRRIVRHILPNISGPLAAYTALHFGWALVNSASLTFLGFGGAPSAPEWGRMMGESRLVFGQAPWQTIAPGLALALTVLAVQRIGEWGLPGDRE